MKGPGTYVNQGGQPSWVVWLATILTLAAFMFGKQTAAEKSYCECSCLDEGESELCLQLTVDETEGVVKASDCLYFTDQIILKLFYAKEIETHCCSYGWRCGCCFRVCSHS